MKHKHVTIFICFLAGLTCCKDDHIKNPEPALPQITSEGKGTLGCLVNGVVWLPNGLRGHSECYYYPWNSSPDFYGTFSFRGFKDNSSEILGVDYSKVFGTGVYILPNEPIGGGGIIKNHSYRINDYGGSGILKIHHFDTISRIISGTFNFKAVNTQNNSDTIYVTDGRFDLKF